MTTLSLVQSACRRARKQWNNHARATSWLLLCTLAAVTPVTGQTVTPKAEDTTTQVSTITPFSGQPVGETLPPGWAHQTLPGVQNANRFDLTLEHGQSILHIISAQSASTIVFPLRADIVSAPKLSWRWKISRAIDGSDFRLKAGDDYAARVYVFFDLPADRLGLGERMKISAASFLHRADIPTAALCYVWGKQQAIGDTGWNPYTDRLRMIVVESGNEHAGQWRKASRDVAADFIAAFGEPVPPISGIAISADTDNTGEAVETYFGDIRFDIEP